jgi:hypothetical protein
MKVLKFRTFDEKRTITPKWDLPYGKINTSKTVKLEI